MLTVITTGAAAFVLVGGLAWIGLETVRPGPRAPKIYSAAPPAGLANEVMLALKVPYDRENEIVRQALLEDAVRPLEVKSLETAVELTQIDRARKPVEPVENIQSVSATTARAHFDPIVITVAAPTPKPNIQSTPQPQIVEKTSCLDELRETAETSTILFQTGSADLDANAQSSLRRIGKLVEGCSEAFVHVTGHSDSTGSDYINFGLSWQRADNAVAALSQLGFDTSQFEPVGFGARLPLSQGDESDLDLDRRVEFHILHAYGAQK